MNDLLVSADCALEWWQAHEIPFKTHLQLQETQ